MITILPFTSNKQISLLFRWVSSNHVGYFTPPFSIQIILLSLCFFIVHIFSHTSKFEFVQTRIYIVEILLAITSWFSGFMTTFFFLFSIKEIFFFVQTQISFFFFFLMITRQFFIAFVLLTLCRTISYFRMAYMLAHFYYRCTSLKIRIALLEKREQLKITNFQMKP